MFKSIKNLLDGKKTKLGLAAIGVVIVLRSLEFIDEGLAKDLIGVIGSFTGLSAVIHIDKIAKGKLK